MSPMRCGAKDVGSRLLEDVVELFSLPEDIIRRCKQTSFPLDCRETERNNDYGLPFDVSHVRNGHHSILNISTQSPQNTHNGHTYFVNNHYSYHGRKWYHRISIVKLISSQLLSKLRFRQIA